MENTEQHLFADNEYQLVQASGGKRFANYIIDLYCFLCFVIWIRRYHWIDESGSVRFDP